MLHVKFNSLRYNLLRFSINHKISSHVLRTSSAFSRPSLKFGWEPIEFRASTSKQCWEKLCDIFTQASCKPLSFRVFNTYKPPQQNDGVDEHPFHIKQICTLSLLWTVLVLAHLFEGFSQFGFFLWTIEFSIDCPNCTSMQKVIAQKDCNAKATSETYTRSHYLKILQAVVSEYIYIRWLPCSNSAQPVMWLIHFIMVLCSIAWVLQIAGSNPTGSNPTLLFSWRIYSPKYFNYFFGNTCAGGRIHIGAGAADSTSRCSRDHVRIYISGNWRAIAGHNRSCGLSVLSSCDIFRHCSLHVQDL